MDKIKINKCASFGLALVTLFISGRAFACGTASAYTLYQVPSSTTAASHVLDTSGDTVLVTSALSNAGKITVITGTSGGLCACGSTDASGCSGSPSADSNYSAVAIPDYETLFMDANGTLTDRFPTSNYFETSTVPAIGTQYSSISLAQTSTTNPCYLTDGVGNTDYFYKVYLCQ
jgi:hypothetical protein